MNKKISRHTIALSVATKKSLRGLAIHPKETYEQIIRRIVLGENLFKYNNLTKTVNRMNKEYEEKERLEKRSEKNE